MGAKSIILESLYDNELEEAYNKVNAKLQSLSLSDDDKQKALQDLMNAVNSKPENYDAFIADPLNFANSVMPVDLSVGIVKNPDEVEQENATNLMKLNQAGYEGIVNEFKLRFRAKPEDAENLAGFLLKIINGRGTSAEGWKNYLKDRCRNGKNKAEIQNKLIPTLVNAYNDRGEGDEIVLPRQVNDDQRTGLIDRNGKSVGTIVVPEGFNQAPIALGDQVVSMDFGYPTINFNSELIKEILHESDKPRLKKLLKVLMERINGSPAGAALIKKFLIGWTMTKTTGGLKRSEMYKLIKKAASAKGIPMLRRPLKVDANELVGESGQKQITVTPLNVIAKTEYESIEMDNNPILEGLLSDVFARTKDENTQQVFGDSIKLPAAYIKQFYTVLVPSGPTGLHNYARYMTEAERKELFNKLKDEVAEEIRTSNHNVNDMVLQRYIAENGGVPPFYILMPRTKANKERLRVCEDTVVNGKVCIKSIDARNKDAYFMDKDIIDSVFEAG
jgi:hypothetical protein